MISRAKHRDTRGLCRLVTWFRWMCDSISPTRTSVVTAGWRRSAPAFPAISSTLIHDRPFPHLPPKGAPGSLLGTLLAVTSCTDAPTSLSWGEAADTQPEAHVFADLLTLTGDELLGELLDGMSDPDMAAAVHKSLRELARAAEARDKITSRITGRSPADRSAEA